jgi:nicotinic acetylcholine receptor
MTLIDAQLEEEKNLLKSDVWVRYAWQDNRLRWDKEALGIKVLRVSPSKVWTPDLTLYNSATQRERMKCWEANVIIYSSGKLLWIPPCHLESYCNLTLSREPYSEQKCNLKFGSWTFDGHTMGLDFWYGKKYADLQDVWGSFDKYELTTNTAVKNEKKYDCCPEPYYSLTFTLGLTRRRSDSTKKCYV